MIELDECDLLDHDGGVFRTSATRDPLHLDLADDARHELLPAIDLLPQRRRLGFHAYELDQRRGVEVEKWLDHPLPLDSFFAQFVEDLRQGTLAWARRRRRRQLAEIPFSDLREPPLRGQPRQGRARCWERRQLRDRSSALGHLERLAALDPPQPLRKVLTKLSNSDALSHVAQQ